MKFRPLAFAALLFVGLAAPSSAQQSQRQWFAEGAIPQRYEISITPNVEAGTFVGQATITVQADEPLTTIAMNALDLEVQRATIDNAQVQAAIDNDAQTLTLTPRRQLRAGRHTIRINYTGRILDDAYGLFRVTYRDANGAERKALATQFEPADARRLAPMWDQPNRRAVFSMTVTAPSDQMAIGNMPIARSQRLSGGLTRTTFEDTPAMSSYLLFLAVGDFERITQDVDGTTVGVVVRRGETERARYALEAGVEVVRYYNEYFGIRYPLPKLDMIGVPGAGGFGAMENWGAILYFDQYLLLDADRSSVADRQGVFSIIAHEIAHQWFGNLVTMQWWDDLWLNEGFASWMAAKAIDELHNDWNPWTAQLAMGYSDAMALDARVGTHPIVQTVNTIDEANLAFDDITYDKGQAVLRMLEAYVGEDAWRRGVHDYLAAHTYGNATTEDLWSAVQAASGQPILEIAHSFTRQPGFPVLTTGACSNGSVAVTQRRFALDEVSRTNERWHIPLVTQQVGGDANRSVLPAESNATVNVGGCGAYLLDAGHNGFFRTHYDEANFNRLRDAFQSLNAGDQLGLMIDYYAFGQSGDDSFERYLDLVNKLPADADPIVVMDVATRLGALAAYASDRPSAAAVRTYALGVLRPQFERSGWTPREGETANEMRMRAALIEALGGLGDEAVVAEARQRVTAMFGGDASAVPASIRSAALSVYGQNATAADYDTLLARARAATDFVEQRRLWLQVGAARDEALARRTLEIALTDDVPRQIRTQVLTEVAERHPRMAWDFLVAHRSDVEALLDPLSRLEYPGGIAGQSSDPAIAAELERYAANFPEGAQLTVRSTASSIRQRATVIERGMPQVERWLGARNRPQRRR